MTLAKREWNPRISLDEALACSVGWLVRARQKNVLSNLPPTLYTAYVVDDAPHLGLMRDLSSLFRYSAKDDPEIDRARDQALRLLSVALKAHFFLNREALARHEPYLFSLPDLSNPASCHYGLVYRLEGRPSQTIVVATCDLGLSSTLRPSAFKFPVALTKNSFKWFDKKHWAELAKEANLLERLMKPWIAKQELNVIEKWTDEANFPFGAIIDVPYDLKDHLKPTGIKWADTLKKWYLPLGFDVDSVREYARWVASEHKDNRDAFEARSWRLSPAAARRRSAPAQPTGSESAS